MLGANAALRSRKPSAGRLRSGFIVQRLDELLDEPPPEVPARTNDIQLIH